MRSRSMVVLLAGVLAMFGGHAAAAREAPARKNTQAPAWPRAPRSPPGAPNVLLVLLDDVGFGAAGTFGGPTETPALDRLASQGLRYNQFHTTALCSPTRAALLSGRNHHRASFGTVTEIGNSHPGYNAFWPKSVASLPEVLRRNGYSTAAFGKWHNTPPWEISPVGPFDRWPTGLGFEYFYGFMLGEASQWETPLYRNTTPVEPSRSPREGYHVTTDLVDDAIRWVHTHESVTPEKPYFLYFATGATHAPHHVAQAWVDKFKGRFDQGWDKLREETFARQKKLGVIPASAELTPRPAALPAWDGLSADQKRLYARQAEVYAAFLAQTDDEIGRLVDSVRKGPNGENTLVLYIVGDNGASAEGGLDGSDDNAAAVFSGLGTDVARQLTHLDKLGSPELDNHFASAWAWGFDAPFQWTKQVASHFGGTRNPLVVSWPARIKDVGAVRSQFSHVNDIAPTIYELAGIEAPRVVDGVKQEPIDGKSFAKSFFEAKAPSQHRVQYFEQLGNRAIYEDGWVAAAFHAIPWSLDRGTDFDRERWELYNVNEDFSEAHDLAAKYPAKLAELKKLFDDEARKNHVYPLGNGLTKDFLTSANRPTVADGHDEFLYYGTTPRLPASAVPNLVGSHRITASIEVPGGGATGVIVADGGRYGGFALYVKDGHLVYEQNFFGRERSVITSTVTIPAGHHEVRFDFERQAEQRWGGGEGRLSIDGQPAGEGKIAHVGIASFIDTFDVGADRGSPVSEAYAVPAKFNGKVEWVRLTRSTLVGRANAASAASPLATADQREVEEQAIALLSAPDLQRQRAATLKRFEADPTAATKEGRDTLRQAVDELTFAAALAAVNGDPTRPKVTWAFTAPRTWLGHEVPGSRWGIDNPDNVYRLVPIDGTSRYEIAVRPGKTGPAQFSFLLYSSFAGEGGKRKELDTPIAGLRDRDIRPGADGAFTITVDADPAAGRPNHIRSTGDARYLLVRNTFDRWDVQTPLAVEVRRVGGPKPAPPASREVLAQKAAALLEAAAQSVLEWKSKALPNAEGAASNAIARPFTRGGGWGFASSGRYKLGEGEGLLVTLDPSGAEYLGFDLTDSWLVSREHVRAAGSLNNHQAVANADGTYSYVIAAQDPGIANWLDTGGLHEGQLLIRWQVLPEATKSIQGAVREVKVVKLADLTRVLPVGTPRVTPAERKAASEARARAYAHRYSGDLFAQSSEGRRDGGRP